jgi:competence protein ComEC
MPFFGGICSLIILAFFTFGTQGFSSGHSGLLEVTFLDVGQGDATFIESPSGTQVLIDGGRGSVVMGGLQKVTGFFDRDIDMVVATHPDLDHIEGLISVLDTYTVHTILMTENFSTTLAFELFLNRVHAEGADVIYARSGQIYDLGLGEAGSTTLTILFPDLDPTNLESNMASIVSRLTYGKNAYMFTGDSPQEIEKYLVHKGTSTLASDVLKVGHHGSRTSSSEDFVTAVAPTYAIISAGKNNSYGHPHKEVTDLLTKYSIIQKNTATEGSIFSFSDGNTVWFK